MSEQSDIESERGLEEIIEVEHYTGGEHCHYQCGEPAEFVVRGRGFGKVYTFAGCRACLNSARIWPIVNEWVDELDHKEQVRNS